MKPYIEPIAEYCDRSAVPPAPDPPTAAAPIIPDRKSEAQRAYREARVAIALLQERWPAAFPQTPQQIWPLITGAVPLIAAALDWSHPYARAVLRTWKLRPAYCHAVLAHPVRFDLDGNPTNQPIDEDTRTQAQARLAAWASKRRPAPRAVAPTANHDPQQQGATAGRDLAASRPQLPQQPSPAPAPGHPAPKPRRRLQTTSAWRPGDKVRWQDYAGTFLRETVDDQAEVLIGTRTYRLPKAELRPA